LVIGKQVPEERTARVTCKTTNFPIEIVPKAVPAQYGPHDDLRHRPMPGQRMRDSLFWEVVLPEEQLAVQVYLYLTGAGKVGFNVAVWGSSAEPLVLDHRHGQIPDDMDLDDFSFSGLSLKQPELRRSASIRYVSDKIDLSLDFEGMHPAFSFTQNPDGLPGWFATDRFEQTGWVKGKVRLPDGRMIELDRIGHRDHSWGVRDWSAPQHWKWIVAYTPDGSHMLNGWIWFAHDEWGFAGYVVRDRVLVPVCHIRERTTYDDDGGQLALEADFVDIRGGTTRVTLDRFGLLKLPSNEAVVLRAACRATIDGLLGAGMLETLWATSYFDAQTRKGRS
jgi:hypothetical protein